MTCGRCLPESFWPEVAWVGYPSLLHVSPVVNKYGSQLVFSVSQEFRSGLAACFWPWGAVTHGLALTRRLDGGWRPCSPSGRLTGLPGGVGRWWEASRPLHRPAAPEEAAPRSCDDSDSEASLSFLQYPAGLHSPAWWEGPPSAGENVGPDWEAHE